MQEHWKILPDLTIARCEQRLCAAAYHHPIAILDGPAQQTITHRAADLVDVHQRSVLRAKPLAASVFAQAVIAREYPALAEVSGHDGRNGCLGNMEFGEPVMACSEHAVQAG